MRGRGRRFKQEDDRRMNVVADITFGMRFGIVRKKSLSNSTREVPTFSQKVKFAIASFCNPLSKSKVLEADEKRIVLRL